MRFFGSLLLLALSLSAANHYVRAGAAGSANGDDWTNAYTALPAALTRGDTYYVADGTYSNYTFDDAASGTTVITIKKATVADHGTETGWVSTYGDGQAGFGPLVFSTPYWTLDGATRTGMKSGHGFVITTSAAVNPSQKGIVFSNGTSGNVTIRYVEIAGHGPDGDGGGNDLIYTLGASDVTIQYCHLHDSGRVHILTRIGSNWLVEHTAFVRNEGTPTEHSEAWSIGTLSDVVVRFCLFEDIESTGILATLDNNPGPDNWEIYGNVFNGSNTGDGIVCTDAESSWTNVKFYHNTIIGAVGHSGFRAVLGGSDTWLVYNNLWYNNIDVAWASTVHDYNWFYASGTNSEAHAQNGTGDPFVNLAAGNFRLAANTTAGTALGAPYNVDMDGVTRSTWSRGAFEYVSGLPGYSTRQTGGSMTGGSIK